MARGGIAHVTRLSLVIAFALLTASTGWGSERFPPPDFESGYQLPSMTRPLPRAGWQEFADVVILIVAMSLAAWIALRKRSRRAMAWLSVFSLAYFGLYREGCICPIGSIQNVSLALADSSYFLPFTVVLIFALPLLFALLFGRVFCGGVCPLGAMQDVVLIKPVRVPTCLQTCLSVLPFVYLGGAVLFAALDTMFIICQYDPFVPFFRFAGPFHMFVIGGAFLLVSVFVGRPYCRFLCPYGALLGLCSRWAWRRVTITPDECVVCSLCEDACAFGAIRTPTPEGAAEES